MFDTLKALPEDPILGLSVAYKADTNPKKIDLGVGVYKDDNSVTPVMTSVKKAEQFLFNAEDSKAYLPPAGTPGFISAIEAQIFGVGHSALLENRVATIPAPGGSGALRVAAEFIVKAMPNARLWVSSPTWANHHNLLGSAGLEISDYDYYCAETKAVDFVAMEKALLAVPAGDVVLLHGCCHNPSALRTTACTANALAQPVLSARAQLPLPLLVAICVLSLAVFIQCRQPTAF
jgi:aspartate aminotransferase